MRFVVVLVLVLAGIHAATPPVTPVDAVKGLISRMVGAALVPQFNLTVLSSGACGGPGCFILSPSNSAGMVSISGTSGVELSAGLGYYLKYWCNNSVSWRRTGGNQLRLPSVFPPVASTVKVVRAVPLSYYQNVVTSSYSFVWWDWKRWEEEIDWMALNGVNLPLAFNGQERVWQKVYTALGVNDTNLGQFFAGPAFLAWSRGQGLRAWGGPLPQNWMQKQWDLQRQILPRMRSFGMTPILPAFQGNVPFGIQELFPTANISRMGDCGPPSSLPSMYGCPDMLDSLDPLFQKIANQFMTTLIQDFGTDHYYSADGTFSHASAPWKSEGPERDVEHHKGPVGPNPRSAAAYRGMSEVDPQAQWVYQTWSWHWAVQTTPNKTLPIIQSWVEAVPKGRLILLDLFAESVPLWNKTNFFFDTPFIWCMLHNFGGNIGMWGDFRTIGAQPQAAMAATPYMWGIGLTPEGIDQNPVIYDFMLENAYRSTPMAEADIMKWVSRYADRRYAWWTTPLTDVHQAWQTLANTVYNCQDFQEHHTREATTSQPVNGSNWDGWDATLNQNVYYGLWYNPIDFAAAWHILIESSPYVDSDNAHTYYYDLANVARQVLSKESSIVATQLVTAANARNLTGVASTGALLLEILNDLDVVLNSVEDFMLGPWLADALATASSASEATLIEYNARQQVTEWLFHPPGQSGPLQEYANKEWGGLVGEFYMPRWQMYITQVTAALTSGKTFDSAQYLVDVLNFTDTFAHTRTPFPVKAVGHPVELSRTALAKYKSRL